MSDVLEVTYTNKVYVRLDDQSRILEVGSDAFLNDLTGWTEIDEGTGDKYLHAQSGYLPLSTYEQHGIPRYKLIDGAPVERTQSEIDTDIAALPEPAPTPAERITELESIVDTLLISELEG